MNRSIYYSLLFIAFLKIEYASAHPFFTDFDTYQNRYTKEEILNKLDHYLVKDEELNSYFKLTNHVFYLYSSPENKSADLPEYTIQLAGQTQSKLTTNSCPSLKGMKIALDPGHFGGEYATLEQRWIYMSPEGYSPNKQEIQFNEGTLTLLTAKILRGLLEQAGAQVLLTKENNGYGVYDIDFGSWLKNFPNEHNLSQSDLFRQYFNSLDLRARAKKINAFNPDFTVIIHYNAHNDRDPLTQENIPTNHNYNMVFVPGSFCKGELKDPESRYEFIRLLLTQDLDSSVLLSTKILNKFTEILEVPPVDENENISYLKKVCKKIDTGVYARNLNLTRLIHGPLCYGETLCQDDLQECVKLSQKDLIVDGIQGPKRVEEVAQAYFKGIVEYIEKR